MAEAHLGSTATAKRTLGQSWSKQLLTTVWMLLGLGLLGAGVAAVFLSRDGAGSAALLVVGALMIFFGLAGDRLTSVKFGDLELALRDEADEEERRGNAEAAEVLRRAADTLGQRVTKVARSYKSVRSSMPAGLERTARMEQIIAEARKDAFAPDIDEEEILKVLWTGSVGARIWALGILQARPELANTRAVLEAVLRPDEMFDQYHALVLAELFAGLPQTRTWARERVQAAVRSQLETEAPGTDRNCHAVANRVLGQEARSIQGASA